MQARSPILYQGFLSYSHAADGRLAPALQSGLHRFARSWYRLRAVRVFRDQTTLAVTPELWPAIARALDASEHLLLMASPAAAASEWVCQELTHWLSHTPSRAPKILIALTEGEIVWGSGDFDWTKTTALPGLLSKVFKSQPLYVDLRWAKSSEDLSLRNARFADAVASFAAPLHGVPKDEIVGEDVRRNRRARWIATAAGIAIVAAASVASWQAYVARRERAEAERERTTAVARELAARATLLWQRQGSQIEPALLLAAESVRREPTPEAGGILLEGLALTPRWLRTLGIPATGAALSPRGDRLAAKDEGSPEVVLFDAVSGRRLFALPTPLRVMNLAFSPDGTRLLAGGARDDPKTTIWGFQVWDLATRRQIEERSYRMMTAAPSFDASGRFVVVRWRERIGGDLQAVSEVVDLATGRNVDTDERRRIAASAYDPYSAYEKASRFGLPIPDLSATGTRFALNPQEDLLAVIDPSGQLAVWDIPGKRPLWQRGGQGGYQPYFERRGGLLATLGSAETHLWNARTGAEISRLSRAGGSPFNFSLSSDESRVLTGNFAGALHLWDLSVLRKSVWELSPKLLGYGHLNARGSVVLGGATEDLRVWQARSGRPLLRAQFESLQRWDGAALDPSGRYVARGEPFEVRVWDLQTGRQLPSHRTRIISDLTLGGPYLAIASGDPLTLASPTVVVGAIADGSSVKQFRCLEWATTLAMSSSGRRLAAVSNNGRGWLAEVAPHAKRVSLFQAAPQGDPPLEFSPKGGFLAFAAEDGSAVLLDTSTGQEIRRFPHRSLVRGLSFSPDGRLLVTSSAQGDERDDSGLALRFGFGEGRTLTVWSIASGEALSRLEVTAPLLDVRFAEDSNTLVTLDSNAQVRFFPWDPQELRREICNRIGRDLRVDEWRENSGGEEPVPQTCVFSASSQS